MGLEQARAAVESAASTPVSTPTEDTSPSSTNTDTGVELSPSGSNGSLAPDSAKSSAVFDLTKAEKFMWEGKEMTPQELKKAMLRQQDYTKKTQQAAEERRRFEQERETWTKQREDAEKFDSNYEIDIQNVLRDPSLEAKFREIYPAKYHALLEKALVQAFGDPNSPKRNESLLEQRLKSIETKFQQQDMERSRQSFEKQVQLDSEILNSNIDRLTQKYPLADEDSVLARAEYMASSMKKDDQFNANFSQLMEKLYKENHQFHETRYKQIYKEKVEKQKQANTRAKDVGTGGATPAAAPTKLKLRDVKNHILNTMGQN